MEVKMERVSWSASLKVLKLLFLLSVVYGQCARFKFPKLNDSDPNFNVAAGTKLYFPFELNAKGCRDITNNYTITVSKQDKVKMIFNDECKMLIFTNGTCFSFRPMECVCGEDTGSYALSVTVEESDGTLWSWKVDDNKIARERAIRFHVSDDQMVIQTNRAMALHAGVTVSVLIVIAGCTSVIVYMKRRQLHYCCARAIARHLPALGTVVGMRLDSVVYRKDQPSGSTPEHRDSSGRVASNSYIELVGGTGQTTRDNSKAGPSSSADQDNCMSHYQPLNRPTCSSLYSDLEDRPYAIPNLKDVGGATADDVTDAIVDPAHYNDVNDDDDDNEPNEYLAIIA